MARVDQYGNVESSGRGFIGLFAAWRTFGGWLGSELRSWAAQLRMMR